jgi:hypothetical protein
LLGAILITCGAPVILASAPLFTTYLTFKSKKS